MKTTKILLATIALMFSLGAYSQTDTTKKDTVVRKTDTTVHKMDTTRKRQGLTESASTHSQDQQSVISQQSTAKPGTTNSSNNNTSTNSSGTNTNSNTTSGSLSANNTQSSTPKPNFGRYYIPVLGSYNAVATTVDNKSIKVTGDENNAGKIWVEGLSGTRFYALLKTAPNTYKIPAQKQDVTSIAEGTLIYDETSKQINVCTGCGFNEQAPAVTNGVATTAPVVSKSKKNQQSEKVKKTPVVTFTGIKADQGTVSLMK